MGGMIISSLGKEAQFEGGIYAYQKQQLTHVKTFVHKIHHYNANHTRIDRDTYEKSSSNVLSPVINDTTTRYVTPTHPHIGHSLIPIAVQTAVAHARHTDVWPHRMIAAGWRP